MTYGALMAQVRIGIENASASANDHPIDVHRAHAEILGYERFLRVCGHHLKLLAHLAQTDSAAWRSLGHRLERLPSWEVGEGRWSRAASLLGAAHDLVSTHVGPDRSLRTPEIQDLAGGPELLSTVRDVLDQLEAAAHAGDHLLDRTGRRQRVTTEHPTTTHHYAVLRSASRAIAVYGRAAHWDLRKAVSPSPDDNLQGLTAAPLLGSGRSRRFTDSLEALRLLRHLLRAQAKGEVPASPISLRDLALLGARVTDPEQLEELGAHANPVQRLEQAHLKDQLNAAHESWTLLAECLLTQIQGLTKAPREYAFALDQLQSSLNPSLRDAIARALPDLGRSAGDVIRQLAVQNALVSHQREPGGLQAHWRPLPVEHREALAEQFTRAGAASAESAAGAEQHRRVASGHEQATPAVEALRDVPLGHDLPFPVRR